MGFGGVGSACGLWVSFAAQFQAYVKVSLLRVCHHSIMQGKVVISFRWGGFPDGRQLIIFRFRVDQRCREILYNHLEDREQTWILESSS